MKYKLLLFSILLSLATLNSCKGQDENAWIEDINYLSEHLPEKQKDFYKLIDSVDFKQQIDLLKSKTDSLDDIAIILELQKILASLKVSHTMIPIQYGNYLKNLPLKTELFDDGLYIIGIDISKKKYLAKRIVAINNVSVEEIYNRLEPLISYENEYWMKKQIPEFVVKPKALEYLNVIDKADFVSFQLDNEETFELPVQQPKSAMTFYPVFMELTWLKNQKKFYWHDTISDDILYIQYNKWQEDKNYPFEKFVYDIATTINNSHINTILIDLRLNSGGNSQIIKPLIQELKNYTDKKFYAAISKRTFSSGRFAARDLKVELGAELIGEPTGGSPNSYGESKRLILPHSEIPVIYCLKYFSLMDTDKNYFEPDIKIAYNAKDLLEGRDLVLDYIKEL